MFEPLRFSVCRVLVVVALLTLVFPAHANDLVIGKPAPPITLHTLDGQHVSLADLHGKVVIITFWATWCAVCRKELPLLSRFVQAHEKAGLVVLGFSLDSPDKLPQVQTIARTLSFKVGLLGDPHVPGYGRIWYLPVSFVIDRNGLLVDDGWKDRRPAWTQAQLDRVVTPLLQPVR